MKKVLAIVIIICIVLLIVFNFMDKKNNDILNQNVENYEIVPDDEFDKQLLEFSKYSPTIACPLNSYNINGLCYCDFGFIPDEQECIPR